MRARTILLYLLRRLALLVPLALAVTVVVFLLASLVPGGPVAALIAGKATDTATIEAMKARYNLDKPIHEQYWYWISGVARGDLGISIRTSQPVASAILERIGVTLSLNLAGIIICLAIGIPLGIYAAFKRGGWVDRTIMTVALALSGAPAFVVAILALLLFGYVLKWFPLFGLGEGGLDTVWHLALPALVSAVAPLAFITKLTRAAMIDQLDQDYIGFARARGIGFSRVLTAHAMRNAMVPVLTAGGLLLVGLLTGTVFVETVFGLPGLGRLLVTAVQFNDFPVTQGVVLFVAAWIVFVNLLVDLCYALVDPRVEFGRVAA